MTEHQPFILAVACTIADQEFTTLEACAKALVAHIKRERGDYSGVFVRHCQLTRGDLPGGRACSVRALDAESKGRSGHPLAWVLMPDEFGDGPERLTRAVARILGEPATAVRTGRMAA